MPHAIQIHAAGGPDVLRWTEVQVGEPGPGQARIRQAAAGLNYIDVYQRTGYYPQPLPFIPGLEGAGVVEAIGAGVNDLKPGDRVAYDPHGGLPDHERHLRQELPPAISGEDHHRRRRPSARRMRRDRSGREDLERPLP
jgi:NADPH:quinone reductase-like Zn-dependent oxidoreductase